MRYCCLEIRTTCGSCGGPVPVNGPFREITCQSCFEKVRVPVDIYAGFMNDFEDEYQGLEEREGSGGTLMSGSGTYKYGHWRLTPRCSQCRTNLEIPHSASKIICSCGNTYRYYPAPDWLKAQVPSLAFCISSREPSKQSGSEPEAEIPSESLKPIVMSCPQCSGALSISSENERIMTCSYCDTEVYIPDAIWKRLHPVKKVSQWYACFQGKTEKQLHAERRLKDRKEEEEALRTWKARTMPGQVRKKGTPYLRIALFSVCIFLLASLLVNVFSSSAGFGEAMLLVAPFSFAVIAVATPVIFTFNSLFSGRTGVGKLCREALAALAEKHRWVHHGTGNRRSIGYVRESFRGRDIEIDPSSEFAIEIEMDDCPFYLSTSPPGYPPDDLFRFTTGDQAFDDLFPIRYAEPEVVLRMEGSEEEAGSILEPLMEFLSEWGDRIARMQVDWSSVKVHITPGCHEIPDSGGRFVPAEDLEPLFEDTLALAGELDTK